MYPHYRKNEPEHEADEEHVENTRYGVHQRVHYDLGKVDEKYVLGKPRRRSFEGHIIYKKKKKIDNNNKNEEKKTIFILLFIDAHAGATNTYPHALPSWDCS